MPVKGARNPRQKNEFPGLELKCVLLDIDSTEQERFSIYLKILGLCVDYSDINM